MAQDRKPDPTPGTPMTYDLSDASAEETIIAEPAAEGWRIPRAIPYASAEDIAPVVPVHDDPDLPFWLAINRIRGVGPARFRLLLDTYGTAQAAWNDSPRGWQAAGLDARTASAFGTQREQIVPEAELERVTRLRVRVIRVIDQEYPRLLREIQLPPMILYVRGTLTADDDLSVAVVGTRRASTYGRQVTERLVAGLVAQQITIISGLARGIDTAAHSAALDVDGRTIAVLGCGPDLVYPPENARLAARIVEQGAVVTEFAPGTQPEAGNFPARNRLISGLSLGVLVVEAPEDSGALITTRFAAEQGRDVFAVPGNIYSRSSAGANRLIQDGARLVMDAADILSELNVHMMPEQLQMRDLLPENDIETRLLAMLRDASEPLHVDELCRTSGLPVADVSSTLVMMELKGLVRAAGSMLYAPA